MKRRKLLQKAIDGSKNIRIFSRPGIPELVNLQDAKGKPNHIKFASS